MKGGVCAQGTQFHFKRFKALYDIYVMHAASCPPSESGCGSSLEFEPSSLGDRASAICVACFFFIGGGELSFSHSF